MTRCPKCGYQPSLRINIIGDGSAGKRHAKMLRERGHVCTMVDPITTPEYFSVARFAIDNLPDCDAVVIASPPSAHRQGLLEYWDKCPILCEGPVTWVPSAFAGQPHPHMYAGNWLFVPQIIQLKRECERNEPVIAHLWFDYDLARWRPDVDYRDTCYFTAGIDQINHHEMAIAAYLFGRAEEVHVQKGRTGKSAGVDVVSVLVKHRTGVITTINSSWHSSAYQRGIRVVFKGGDSAEIGWASPQDDMVCNTSYGAMLDHWLSAIEKEDTEVQPSLLFGYEAYKALQGEVL